MAESKDRRAEIALKHALGILAGYIAVGAAARGASGLLTQSPEKKHREKLKAYANAAYPVFSPDTDLKDSGTEEFLRRIGMPKESARKPAEGIGQRLADTFLNILPSMRHPADVGGFVDGVSDPKYHWSHPALTGAAAVGGTALGWKLVSALADKKREKELDKKIAEARNEMDQLIAQEYARNKRQKEASWLPSIASATGKSLMMYALLASVVAGIGTKAYMDDKDPARKRLKAIKRYAADKAVLENAPSIIDLKDAAEAKETL